MDRPLVRPLKVYAFDPTLGRNLGNHMTVSVPYESLKPGPVGSLLAVVDYDASNERYYTPIDLDRPEILVQGGLHPSESDPRFHQQMVYAVASETIRRFGFALGRAVRWSRRGGARRLRIFPHAMQEANAYYSPELHALVFGYFAASGAEVGRNLPGQTVFTCLSHDIVAHETAHALVHSLRRHFTEATGLDTLAFHEAFADIVALFQHFSYREALLDTLQRTGGELHRLDLAPEVAPARGGPRIQAEIVRRNPMVELARQFGEALGTRAALRSALGTPPDPSVLERLQEPHERGGVLVAAVFDAFFTVYLRRTRDLMRIARTGGAAAIGDLDADLANRLAVEAAKTAEHFLTICVRALDYCPPVDVTFGDFLRALVTADYDIVPDDDRGYREALIEAFRLRGIHPDSAASYSESALLWQPPEKSGRRPLRCRDLDFDVIHGTDPESLSANARRLNAFGARHARALGLRPDLPVYVHSFHPVHRVGPDGDLRFQIVVELLQQTKAPLWPNRKGSPNLTFRGGATLVLNADGTVRYAVYKRLASRTRLARQRAFCEETQLALSDAAYGRHRFGTPMNFSLVHRGY